MSATEYYVLTIAVFAVLNAVLALGMNMQFGQAGLLNLAFMVLVAVGAYMTGIAALPPAGNTVAIQYVGGWGLAFPLDLLVGVASTFAVGTVLGLLLFLRNLRTDYFALGIFAFGLGLWNFIENYPSLFNGTTGLAGIPGPGQNQLSGGAYQFVFLGISLAVLALVWAAIWAIDKSPLGRAIKAVRDNELAFAALGKRPLRYKMVAFLVGSLAAGLGGGLFAIYSGGWSTGSWQTTENFILLAAVIVGGRGRPVGAVVGSLLLMTIILEASSFLPVLFGQPNLLADLQQLLVMVIFLAFLWWRPQGLLPEQPESFTRKGIWARRGARLAMSAGRGEGDLS